MITQIVKCKLKNGGYEQLEALLNSWAQNDGPKTPGFRSFRVNRRLDDPMAISVHVDFEDKESIDRFSNSAGVQELFKKAQQLVVSGLEYYEIEATMTHLAR